MNTSSQGAELFYSTRLKILPTNIIYYKYNCNCIAIFRLFYSRIGAPVKSGIGAAAKVAPKSRAIFSQ